MPIEGALAQLVVEQLLDEATHLPVDSKALHTQVCSHGLQRDAILG